MTANQFDIVIVGGGIGGSALAKAMATHGARVLVVEKERQFRDRVRGEAMAPWGVPEARALGIDSLLRGSLGHEIPWVNCFLRSTQFEHRNLLTTSRHQTPQLAFYHPAMQEVLLAAAQEAGAKVCRGATARELKADGEFTSVILDRDGATNVVQGRLVVGADGRLSKIRRLAGFDLQSDPEERMLAGVLLEGMEIAQDSSCAVLDPRLSQLVALFPQGGGRVRAYFSYPIAARDRLQGAADLPEFIEESKRTGARSEWYANVRAIGPLASFQSDDVWVNHPYRRGVALIGDAAASNDPMYGQGLSLTLRDARVLYQHLIASDRWDEACHAYADAHDRYYRALYLFCHCCEELFYQTGPAGDKLRARALPPFMRDRTRIPDFFFAGPDDEFTDEMRQRMLGEDLVQEHAQAAMVRGAAQTQ